MICQLEVNSYDVKDDAATKEIWNRLRDLVSDWPEWKDAKPSMWGERFTVDLTIVGGLLSELGLSVKIKPFKNNAWYDLQNQLKTLERKLSLVENYKRMNDGTIVQVHVPNAKLIEFNEVQVVEDSCTNQLQEELLQGWRIIAVCPPLEQRRPDYILGRFNKELIRDDH